MSWRNNPWWIPPFLGAVPDIEPRLLRLLGLVSLAMFFEQYDLSMLTGALKFIAEDLGVAEKHLGGYLSVIRLGALPAFFVVPFADRLGRRGVFLGAVLGISLTTFGTAFSQSITQFVVLQMLARTFMVACTAVALVIVTEEFPALHRGWGLGMLGALAACGNGLGAILFAAIEHLPFGWRALYTVGILPLMLLPLLRREVHETGRFTRHRARQLEAAEAAAIPRDAWFRPLIHLLRIYPLRVAVVGLVAGLLALGSISVFQFTAYFTLTVHGWSPAHFSAMVVFGGAIGIIGNVAAGRLGDRIGRRVVGLAALGIFPVFAALFYQGPSWSVPIAWVFLVFCATAGQVVVRALSTELFPTAHRGTSAGWLAVVETLGAAAGLGLLRLGTAVSGDIAGMTSLLALAVCLGGLCLLLLPETNRRELEAISAD